MITISLRTVWAHKRRLVGTLIAVTLGVAFLAGTSLLGDTLRSNFDTLFTQADGSTDVVVRSQTTISDTLGRNNRAGLDAGLVDQVAAVPGVARAEPYVEGYGQLLGRDGQRVGNGGPPARAANWIDEPTLNPYHLVEGRAPRADDEVVINRGAAKAGHLAVGDVTALLVPDPVPVKIVGISTFGSADGFGPSTFTGMTLGAAERLLTNDPGRVTQVLVQAAPGIPPDQLATDVGRVLPSGVEAITGTQLAAQTFAVVDNGFLRFLRTALTLFAFIALLVGAFSIFNTFSILAAQRARESALLRALGASRAQVVTTSVVETLVVGAVGAAAGLVAGVGLAGLLEAVFSGAGFALPAGGLVVKPSSLAIAAAAGLVTTVVAGVTPAVRASRVAPLAALRDLAIEAPAVTRRRIVTGTVTMTLGVGSVVVAVATTTATLAGLGAAASLLGAIVLGPVLARTTASVLGRPVAALKGTAGRLARQNAMRNPRRTAASASALMVGVTIVVLFATFGASLKASAAKSVDEELTADVVVDTPGYGGRSGNSGFSAGLADDLTTAPGVATATSLSHANALVGGHLVGVTVTGRGPLAAVLDLGTQQGDVDHLGPTAVAVASSVATARGWQVGEQVDVTFPDGTSAPLTLAAIYERTDLVGDYLVGEAAWAPHAAQDIVAQVLVTVAPGASAADVQREITALAQPFGSPRVLDHGGYVDAATEGVDTILGLVYVMLALAIVIALLGIGNTLSLSLYERTRELGLLRAIGQTRRQTRAMVRWESVILSTLGTTTGLALGTYLGWALVKASGSADLRTFAVPTAQLAVVLVVGAIAGGLAGTRPARRAARLDVLAAVSQE